MSKLSRYIGDTGIIGVFNFVFSIYRIISVTMNYQSLFDNFAYFFYVIEQFKPVHGSIISINRRLII